MIHLPKIVKFSSLAAVLMVGIVATASATDGVGGGTVQLALKDVACVQQCNNNIRVCRSGCDSGFNTCMQRIGKSNPCSEEKASCNTGCTSGHNACVSRCPEK